MIYQQISKNTHAHRRNYHVGSFFCVSPLIRWRRGMLKIPAFPSMSATGLQPESNWDHQNFSLIRFFSVETLEIFPKKTSEMHLKVRSFFDPQGSSSCIVFQVDLEMACLTEAQRCWLEFPLTRCIQWLLCFRKKRVSRCGGVEPPFFPASQFHPDFFGEAWRIDLLILTQLRVETTLKLRLLDSCTMTFIHFRLLLQRLHIRMESSTVTTSSPTFAFLEAKVAMTEKCSSLFTKFTFQGSRCKTTYCIVWVWPPPTFLTDVFMSRSCVEPPPLEEQELAGELESSKCAQLRQGRLRDGVKPNLGCWLGNRVRRCHINVSREGQHLQSLLLFLFFTGVPKQVMFWMRNSTCRSGSGPGRWDS